MVRPSDAVTAIDTGVAKVVCGASVTVLMEVVDGTSMTFGADLTCEGAVIDDDPGDRGLFEFSVEDTMEAEEGAGVEAGEEAGAETGAEAGAEAEAGEGPEVGEGKEGAEAGAGGSLQSMPRSSSRLIPAELEAEAPRTAATKS